MNDVNFRQLGAILSSEAAPATPNLARNAALGGDDGQPLVAQILSVLRRRKWLILGVMAAAVALGLLVTMLMTPLYTATSTLEIERENGNFIEVEGVQPKSNLVDQEFYETQYGLLKSRALAERVAQNLKLMDSRSFFDSMDSAEASKYFDGALSKPGPLMRQSRIREAGTLLLNKLTVKPSRQSRLVEIYFSSPDPALSKRVVDAWSAAFVQTTLDRRYDATSYARRFLDERLTQLRARIDESERKVVAYATREGIVNLPSSVPSTGGGQVTGERSLVADDLANLNRELANATAARVLAESRLSSKGGEVTEAIENPAIATLRERRAVFAADYAKMMVQFEPQYPPAEALQTQIQQLDRSISREESRITGTLRQTYTASVARERELQRKVGQLKQGVLDLQRTSIEYNIYQRDADTNRQLYDALLQRYKEIGVAGGVGVNNIAVVDPADLPVKPSSPRLVLNLGLSLLLGALAGIGLAFALEQIDQGISDPSEVEKNLGLPLLGTVPKGTAGDVHEDLADRKSAVAEAYVSIQTSLGFATDHGIPRSLAVTSSRASEGKSTTAFALASSIARSKRSVLLVDADMRSPSVHHLLEIKNQTGLSNFLSGSDDVSHSIYPTALPTMSVMTAGPMPPSSPELLASERFDRFIELMLTKFDHVVIDGPPVMGLADSPLICNKVEGAVFVMESHGTQKSMARVAIERLRAANAPIMGVVLTKFDAKRSHYGYGYDYGYTYGDKNADKNAMKA
jgi:polysaccharide biosynthesis transport protein